jgi:ferredoxin
LMGETRPMLLVERFWPGAGWNCTLCGDCLSSCAKKSMSVKSFFGEKDVWPAYQAVVIGLHAAFIGLARL